MSGGCASLGSWIGTCALSSASEQSIDTRSSVRLSGVVGLGACGGGGDVGGGAGHSRYRRARHGTASRTARAVGRAGVSGRGRVPAGRVGRVPPRGPARSPARGQRPGAWRKCWTPSRVSRVNETHPARRPEILDVSHEGSSATTRTACGPDSPAPVSPKDEQAPEQHRQRSRHDRVRPRHDRTVHGSLLTL